MDPQENEQCQDPLAPWGRPGTWNTHSLVVNWSSLWEELGDNESRVRPEWGGRVCVWPRDHMWADISIQKRTCHIYGKETPSRGIKSWKVPSTLPRMLFFQSCILQVCPEVQASFSSYCPSLLHPSFFYFLFISQSTDCSSWSATPLD